MKVALVAEGCYPYVVGGVSSWIHSLIRSFPEVEFSVIAILSNRSQRGKFVYDQPPNLTDIYEVYLQDLDWSVAIAVAHAVMSWHGSGFRLHAMQHCAA